MPQMYLGLGLVEAAFDKMANEDKYQKLKNLEKKPLKM